MNKILILDASTWIKKGDAAMVIGTIHALKKHIPDAASTILSITLQING
jgi:hypothetical protein